MLSGAMLPVVRHTPGFDLAKFRIEKAVFLLRRRYSHQNFDTPSRADANVQDHSGAAFSGRYQLNRIVSRGGFSAVYEARDLRDENARLAVKVLNRGSGEQGWVRNRFAHEVAALRSVDHPGIVRVLDSWISPGGEPCLAMPFLDGETLRAALREKPFSPERAARLIRQLGAALAEVHGHGIIHRDLKPENLMLLSPGTEREQCVIIDFGTAGMRAAENELAATTLMAGSFHYMAPERLTGHYSAASDVFSFGAMILEILTGKRLSDLNTMCAEPAFAEELEKTLAATLGAGVAKRLASLLVPACDPDPRQRPADVKIWGEQVAATLGQA
jgi:serine/threonine protein kinase